MDAPHWTVAELFDIAKFKDSFDLSITAYSSNEITIYELDILSIDFGYKCIEEQS
jgi:hypothetical protein